MDAGQHRFADRMVAELRRQGSDGEIEVDERQFSLKLPNGQVLMLGNAYSEWQQAPRLRRRQVLRQYASITQLPSAPESVADARPNLLPRVRDLVYYDILALQFENAGGEGPPAYSFEQLNELLAFEVVYDHPQAVTSVGPETLEAWRLTLEEALRTARANLRDRTRGGFDEVAAGVYASAYGDGYDAARLLLTDLISRLDVQGEHVALVPHRDQLLITGSSDEAGLRLIADLAEPALADSHRQTGRPFVLRGGDWEPLALAADHPLHDRFRRLALLTDAADYADQQAALQERCGDDVFVASFVLSEDEAGHVSSFCSWTNGVASLLPAADHVAFVTPAETAEDADVVEVAWADALAVTGATMQSQDLRPERWRVDTFPDATQLEELRRRAVTPA